MKPRTITKQVQARKLKMKQLFITQWEGENGLNSSVIGLEESGDVFVYRKSRSIWEPFNMTIEEEIEES